MPLVKSVGEGMNARQNQDQTVSADPMPVGLYTNLNWTTELSANQLEIKKQLAEANAPICPTGVVGCHKDHSYTDVHGRVIKDCNMCLSNCEIQADEANVSVHNAKAIYDRYHAYDYRVPDIREGYAYNWAPPPPGGDKGAVAIPDNPLNFHQVVKVDTKITKGEEKGEMPTTLDPNAVKPVLGPGGTHKTSDKMVTRAR